MVVAVAVLSVKCNESFITLGGSQRLEALLLRLRLEMCQRVCQGFPGVAYPTFYPPADTLSCNSRDRE